eukprot:CAMPEP_0170481326 /NCGR_PEP_ID=MMETSP0208-20121228/1812_1 /TAXON_ID=197538 /ORGANISM="Strombidium inclinatum, Strain S3" /LENGTH=223 /DNA_ID=CAMNT_0010754009 /DNA_START=47 /DNA_END=715 /DNA_ORIENTATION=-
MVVVGGRQKLVQQVLQLLLASGVGVEQHAVNNAYGSAGNADGSTVLPEFSDSPVAIVGVVLGPDGEDVVFVEVKLVRDSGGPAIFEALLADVGGLENPREVLPGELSVLLNGLDVGGVLEEGNELGHLVAVDVVGQHEGGHVHVHHIAVSLALDGALLSKNLLPDVVSISAVGADQVVEHAEVDLTVGVTESPAGGGGHDGDIVVVGGDAGGERSNGKGFHNE